MTVTGLKEMVELRRSLPCPSKRRRLREAAGLSQAELGQFVGAAGVDGSTICRWEAGEREPRWPLRDQYVDVLMTLAEATGIAV
jgi:transcriptional regulator with XRE-family HTH domain